MNKEIETFLREEQEGGYIKEVVSLKEGDCYVFKGLQFNDDYYLIFVYIFDRLGINRIKIMDSLSSFIYELIIEGDDEIKEEYIKKDVMGDIKDVYISKFNIEKEIIMDEKNIIENIIKLLLYKKEIEIKMNIIKEMIKIYTIE